MYMNNIKKLYNIMYKNGYGWACLAFFLNYRHIKCAVLCERTHKLNKTDYYSKYWMLMKFFNCNNTNHKMSLYIIPTRIKSTPYDNQENAIFEVMKYFNIKSDPTHKHKYHIIDFCKNLNHDAIQAIHNIIPNDPYLRHISYTYIDRNDPKDEGKKYCFEIKKNRGKRSIFNDNKTRYLRKSLYTKLTALNNIPGISFAYSIHPSDENSDSDIITTATGNGTLNIKIINGQKFYY